MAGLIAAWGEVIAVHPRTAWEELEVRLEDGEGRAVNYPALTGPATAGDRVLLNVTAMRLGLGSGGYHFVMANACCAAADAGPGHIMKLRYTPCQVRVLAAAEEGSPWRERVLERQELGGLPVVAISVHSQLGPVAAGMKAAKPGRRVAYLMTDGGALPLAFSNLVRDLCSCGLLDLTVTAGHAFGGDLEAVGVYDGLLAAAAAGADAVVAGMGPGVVGTASPMGSTALEVGTLVNAIAALGGQPLVALRISFADARPRHQGVSHHSLTALGRLALASALLPLPIMSREQRALVMEQLQAAGLPGRHRLAEAEGRPALAELERRGVVVSSMGRTPADDPAFFLAAGAAGSLAGQLLAGKNIT